MAKDASGHGAAAPAGQAAPGEQQFIKPGFRYDINGLRALAVTAVTLYHYHRPALRGGYLGVDIFYVISGFLMTRIILGELEVGRFSLSGFYGARVKRIVPPLAVLIAAVCVIALIVDPLTGEGIARNALSSLTFVSNLLYASQGGYFAGAPESNWLVHTWSLSVEWQFYMIYPIGLWLLHRYFQRRRAVMMVLAASAALSFLLALAMSSYNESTATWGFYILPTRAWEMCAGGLCAYLGETVLAARHRSALHWTGLALAVGACLLIDSHWTWQPAWTALPVLGTALVIGSGVARPRWAELGAVKALGRWSYSIYLWHWPIIAGLAYLRIPLSPLTIIAGLAVSVVLGALSFILVERGLTNLLFRKKMAGRWATLAVGFGGIVAIAAATTGAHAFETMRTAHLPAPVRAALADDRQAAGDWGWDQACGRMAKLPSGLHVCFLGDPAARDTLVIGDSHVQQFAIRYARPWPKGQGVTFVAQGGCMPAPGVGRREAGSTCQAWVRRAYAFAEHAGYRRIVIGSIWFGYFEPAVGETVGIFCVEQGSGCATSTDPAHYRQFIDQTFDRFAGELTTLRKTGADVTVLEPFPAFRNADPKTLYRAQFASGTIVPQAGSLPEFDRRTAMVRALIKRAAARSGAHVEAPTHALCTADACPEMDGQRGLFKDASHYRGSAVLSPRFAFLDHVIAP